MLISDTIKFFLFQTWHLFVNKGIKLSFKTLFCYFVYSILKNSDNLDFRYFDEQSFDFRHGTDTGDIVPVHQLDIGNSLKHHAVQYQPTRAWLFSEIMGHLPIDYKKYTFIDFGSGKGRVLLLASQFPFKSIIGIEASAELCRIADYNLANIRFFSQKCHNTDSLCIDASTYSLPSGNLVLYFYNPFDQHILIPILEQARNLSSSGLHRIYFIYTNPIHLDIFSKNSFINLAYSEKRYAIFNT